MTFQKSLLDAIRARRAFCWIRQEEKAVALAFLRRRGGF